MSRLTVNPAFGAAATAIALVLNGGAAWAQTASVPADPPATAATPASNDALKAGEILVPPPPAIANLPVVEPIISDEEFNSAVPSMKAEDDLDLDRPLESIAEFERSIAAEQAGANPTEGQAPPLGDPALADGDAVETIGDAPVRDAELVAPLPPISEFQVEPVEFAEGEADEEVLEVKYATMVEGLKPADEETETDLAGLFKGTSALRDGDGTAANVAQVSARLTEDSALIQRILASEGWYDSKVTTRIDRSVEKNGQPLTAVLMVAPGQRYTFSDIVIRADPVVPADLITSNLALNVGEPIIAQRVQGAEAQIAIALPQTGYPFAEVGQRDILLDPETADGVYTLPVKTGPRSKFGGFATTGDLAFDAGHVELLARFERGELYDSRMVDDLRQALVATGLFSTVSVEPKQTGEDAGEGTEYVTIAVDQDAGPPRTLAGSLGYGTGQGFRAEASWTHRNLFPPEGALIGSVIGGTQEQGASVTFRRSNAGRRDRTFELGASALHSDYDAFEAFTGRLGVRWSYESTPIWRKTFTWAYGAEIIGSNEDDYDFTLGARDRKTYFIGALTGQVGLDFSDDLLDPTRGFRLSALVQPEGSLQGGFSPYARVLVNGSAYYPAGDSIVLAGRVRLGTIQGVERADIAPSRRFYGGGGGSVRGYGYQDIGPRDPDNDPLGGRSVNEAAAEVRYRFGNFGVVGFFDAGNVYESEFPQFSDLRYGAGLGGRYYTNFGPLRVDFALPLNRRSGDAKYALYISIGQAF